MDAAYVRGLAVGPVTCPDVMANGATAGAALTDGAGADDVSCALRRR